MQVLTDQELDTVRGLWLTCDAKQAINTRYTKTLKLDADHLFDEFSKFLDQHVEIKIRRLKREAENKDARLYT